MEVAPFSGIKNPGRRASLVRLRSSCVCVGLELRREVQADYRSRSQQPRFVEAIIVGEVI